jgi:uncharacterized Fe-S cluster protein YjdI
MSESEKKYSNGEITVIWKPGVSVHSRKCVQSLGEVFNVKNRLWTNITARLPAALSGKSSSAPPEP